MTPEEMEEEQYLLGKQELRRRYRMAALTGLVVQTIHKASDVACAIADEMMKRDEEPLS